jgi:capsular polysaccharide biosynthesis protein
MSAVYHIDKGQGMNLVDYLRILVRRGWIILLLALIAAGSAYVLTQGQTPIYRSTQRVLLQPSRADLGLSESIIRIMESYALYLNSSLQAQKVIDDLQLDVRAEELLGRVNVDADSLRLMIQVDVDDTSPDQANRIATAYGELLRAYQNERNQRARREDRIDVELQDVARASLNRPRPAVNAAAGGVLGVLLGALIVFVLEFLESNIVRRREDVERVLSIPVLAAVPVDLGEAVSSVPERARSASGAATAKARGA